MAADAVGTIGVNGVLAALPFVSKDAKGALSEEMTAARVGGGLSESTISEIKAIPKGSRPDPSSYMSKEAIDAHLELFKSGSTKLSSSAPGPNKTVGPPGGTFVMPKSVADDLIARAGDDPSALERELGLNPGTLGSNPVRIDIPGSGGLRMPNGNEIGANDEWVPGGVTAGGIPEATVSPAAPGSYTVTPIFGGK